MPNYKTPGVYIEEIPAFPPSVVPVATAVPAFIGYTHKTEYKGKSLINVPTKIDSMAAYVEIFGTVKQEVTLLILNNQTFQINSGSFPTLTHRMYYSLRMFFDNGGRECYIVSVGADTTGVSLAPLRGGLEVLAKEDEPTILVFPDALGLIARNADGSLNPTNFYRIYREALAQCKTLMDRVVLIDVFIPQEKQFSTDDISTFRAEIGPDFLDYGIAYYPNLETTLNFEYDPNEVVIRMTGAPQGTILKKTVPPTDPTDESSLFHSKRNNVYSSIVKQLSERKIILPPSSAMAGIYARVDRTRGVHIAPANVGIIGGKPTVVIDDDKQKNLNVPNDGKSINAIRSILGRGNSVVWGARTLDGSSNEWRYVNVRRFYNYVEQSVKQSSFQFVFEPNDKNTWERIKSMITNFLTNEWSIGALAGDKPEDAFFVNVGLGSTMSSLDILEGRLIIEIGMAVVRPAEFIILKFSHKMQEA